MDAQQTPSKKKKKKGDDQLKVVLLGGAAVGKTALFNRFVDGQPPAPAYKPTVGVQFAVRPLKRADGGSARRGRCCHFALSSTVIHRDSLYETEQNEA